MIDGLKAVAGPSTITKQLLPLQQRLRRTPVRLVRESLNRRHFRQEMQL